MPSYDLTHFMFVDLNPLETSSSALTAIQGRDGFLVTTAGPPLTRVGILATCFADQTNANTPKEQIEDLKDASREYEQRQAEKAGEGQDCFLNKPVPVSGPGRRSFS
jgi:hypothetical protein